MPIEIRNRRGEGIAYVHVPGTPEPSGAPGARVASGGGPIVVIGHGVTSDKDRPWSVALSRALQARGLASLRIAFAGNGESQGRFADSNITSEVEDLAAVARALGDRPVAYVGHSMGGAVGIVYAAAPAGAAPPLAALVTLAPIVHCGAFVERLFGGLVPGRDVMLQKPHCPLSQGFVDDLRRHGSLVAHAARIDVPWLVVHGDRDDVVPIQDSLDLTESAGARAEWIRLDGVDHSFTGDGSRRMTAAVAPWLARVLLPPRRGPRGGS